ncbi:MAG: heme-binding protein [Mucilaginibacter sp.]|nr:heme-binding protein [Mucilaginibacter sp.]
MGVTYIQAQKIAEAAKRKAEEIGVPMNIAVVDEGANLKLFIRMDNALLGSGDIAIKKARTSSFFNIDSEDVGKQSQPGGPLYNIEETNGGLVSFPEGLVLKSSTGEIIGAIGVSGGKVEQDLQVASFGMAALEE